MSDQPLLLLEDVSIAAGDQEICHNLNLRVNEGECHILLGPNGSGKSTLLQGIMGVTPFHVTHGRILIRGKDITNASIAERARSGVGLGFQHPPAIPGVSVARFAKAIGAAERLAPASAALGLDHLEDRDVGLGFSGGERKRWEIAKLALQSPSLCLFDEPESGVDLEQVAAVGTAINELLDSPDREGRKRAALIITHTGFILDSVNATLAHLMIDGRLVTSGDPTDLFASIRREGYRAS